MKRRNNSKYEATLPPKVEIKRIHSSRYGDYEFVIDKYPILKYRVGFIKTVHIPGIVLSQWNGSTTTTQPQTWQEPVVYLGIYKTLEEAEIRIAQEILMSEVDNE